MLVCLCWGVLGWFDYFGGGCFHGFEGSLLPSWFDLG